MTARFAWYILLRPKLLYIFAGVLPTLNGDFKSVFSKNCVRE